MRRLGGPPPRTGPSRRWESRCACTSLPPLPGEHHQLESDRIPRWRALRNARTPPARRLEAEVSEPYQDERPDEEHTNGASSIRSARARRERDERIHPSRLLSSASRSRKDQRYSPPQGLGNATCRAASRRRSRRGRTRCRAKRETIASSGARLFTRTAASAAYSRARRSAVAH